MKTYLASILVASSGLPLAFGSILTVGPDFHRPEAPTAAAYRDSDYGSWKVATPADHIARGAWWKAFNDDVLDRLEERALAGNPSLQASVARVEQARAAAGLARSAYWPSVTAVGDASRDYGNPTVNGGRTGNAFRATIDAGWELDLFGRVRRLSEGARADAAAAVAAHEGVRLSLSAEVASTYFSLRALDAESAVVSAGLKLRQETRELARSRFAIGATDELDVARAEAELALTESDAAELANRRAALNNALAVLVGEAAPNFALAPAEKFSPATPVVPAGLPADLLERRPDIAAAERALAASNARIGVAKAAFFPAISLTGAAGYASSDIDHVFNWNNRIWSIGPSLYLPVFQGGRNRANLDRSRAAYDEAVAHYRELVLVALREVQDALTSARLLGEQEAAQARAVESARRAAELSRTRYQAGFVSYLDVIQAERTALDAQRGATQIAAKRYLSSVALIKALGGTWANNKENPT